MNPQKKTVNMVVIENADFSHMWECSGCRNQFKDTKKFCRSKTCPFCGKDIYKWIDKGVSWK